MVLGVIIHVLFSNKPKVSKSKFFHDVLYHGKYQFI